MLDKSKVYRCYSGSYHQEHQVKNHNYKQVKILFEDDISFYAEDLRDRKDSQGINIRRSFKKHCFTMIEEKPVKPCENCPIMEAAGKMLRKL